MDEYLEKFLDPKSGVIESKIPEGWYKRFGKAFLADLKDILEANDCLDSAKIREIKVKYGSLMFDLRCKSDEWEKHIPAWEYISEHTCVKCGKFPVPMRNDGHLSPWCDNCFRRYRISKDDYGYIGELTDDDDFPLEYVYSYMAEEDIDMKPYYKKIGYSFHGLENEKQKKYREAEAKYEFLDTDRSFVTLDEHCWTIGIDVIQCNKIDTGDRIELSSNTLDPHNSLKCEAPVYQLVFNKEERRRLDIPNNFELYVAIGETEDGYTLVCNTNTSFNEEIKYLNRKARSRKDQEKKQI